MPLRKLRGKHRHRLSLIKTHHCTTSKASDPSFSSQLLYFTCTLRAPSAALSPKPPIYRLKVRRFHSQRAAKSCSFSHGRTTWRGVGYTPPSCGADHRKLLHGGQLELRGAAGCSMSLDRGHRTLTHPARECQPPAVLYRMYCTVLSPTYPRISMTRTAREIRRLCLSCLLWPQACIVALGRAGGLCQQPASQPGSTQEASFPFPSLPDLLMILGARSSLAPFAAAHPARCPIGIR